MKHVLVIDSESVLSAAIKHLLTRETSLRVQSSRVDSKHALAEEVRRCKPDVLIMDEVPRVMDEAELPHLLALWPRMEVIVVNFQDNIVQRYKREEILMKDSKSLVDIILG